MKTLKSKLVKLLIAVCACAICITAVPAATQNVQAATRKTYVLSKSQEEKALKLVKGTWYTMGGTPYHYKVVFSGKAIKEYAYGSSKVCYTYKIDKIYKTSYGYYFRIPLGRGYYSGFRLYAKDKKTLQSMGNGKPNSNAGYSGGGSLVRKK